jgi:glycogen operon protein
MNKPIKTTYFSPDHKGVVVENDGVSFCTDQVGGEGGGVAIFDEKGNPQYYPFSEAGRRGCLYGLKVHMEVTERHAYLYYQGEKKFLDRDARLLLGNNSWGVSRKEKPVRCGFYLDDYDWDGDRHPDTPFSDSVIYGLNVRAFTMHRSSGVKKKGSFAGVCEKIPYLRELGVTAVELLPAYDFDEYETYTAKGNGKEVLRLNCWGFKNACFYAPKSAYAGGKRADAAFKDMVKRFHQSGIEVYMYFYFPPETGRADILDILRYWVIEYHLDGFHLLGVGLPLAMITQDSILSGTKIIYNEYAYWENEPRFNNTGVFRDHFLTNVRQLIKGDDDMIGPLLYHQRSIPSDRGGINYLAAYGGFSLFDMTAYDKKKNEANGEDNKDGTNYNYSWNCGVEGPSRKKHIMALRTKQIKNALSLLILSQGTPFIFSGDEFGNTRMGNNNAYCQDNDTGWVKWSDTEMSRELRAFTKGLLAFRKSHPILRMPKELRILDWQRCGYPDISYHGEEAWRPDLAPYSRTVGIMLCGKYAPCEDDFIYIAVNMHWQEQPLALPHLPKGLVWTPVCSTDENPLRLIADGNFDGILARGRSVCVLISEPERARAKKKRG